MKLVEMAFFSDDVPAMTAFYRKLLGQEPVYDGGNIAIFQQGEVKIFLHERYEPAGPDDLPPENHTAFAVPDVDAACAELAGQGLIIEVPRRDYYWGRSAYLRNPDGFLIELIAEAGAGVSG